MKYGAIKFHIFCFRGGFRDKSWPKFNDDEKVGESKKPAESRRFVPVMTGTNKSFLVDLR